jgi:hypothetical protein
MHFTGLNTTIDILFSFSEYSEFCDAARYESSKTESLSDKASFQVLGPGLTAE